MQLAWFWPGREVEGRWAEEAEAHPGTRSRRKLPLSGEVGGVLQRAVPAGGEGPRCSFLAPPSPSVGRSRVRSALLGKAKEDEGLGADG